MFYGCALGGVAEGRCGGALVGVVCDDEPDGFDRDEPGNA